VVVKIFYFVEDLVNFAFFFQCLYAKLSLTALDPRLRGDDGLFAFIVISAEAGIRMS